MKFFNNISLLIATGCLSTTAFAGTDIINAAFGNDVSQDSVQVLTHDAMAQIEGEGIKTIGKMIMAMHGDAGFDTTFSGTAHDIKIVQSLYKESVYATRDELSQEDYWGNKKTSITEVSQITRDSASTETNYNNGMFDIGESSIWGDVHLFNVNKSITAVINNLLPPKENLMQKMKKGGNHY